jgi:hypothetical protein
MFKQVLAVLAIGLVVTSDAPAQEAPTQAVVVPRGTVLKLSTVQPLDSATARPGDDIPLRLSRPLVVNGVTLLREGDVLHGRVTDVKRAGKDGSVGIVGWKLDRIPFADHSAARSTYYFVPIDQEVPEHAEIKGLKVSQRIGLGVAGAIFVPPALAMMSPLLLFAPLRHAQDKHAEDCNCPGQEFHMPAETRVAVVITRSHHVRF